MFVLFVYVCLRYVLAAAAAGRRTVVEVSFEHLKLGEGQKKKSRVIPGAKPLLV